MKLPERIAQHFKAAAFVGVRKSDQGLRASFFINDRDIEVSDLGVMIGGLQKVREQLESVFHELLKLDQGPKQRKRKKTARKPA